MGGLSDEAAAAHLDAWHTSHHLGAWPSTDHYQAQTGAARKPTNTHCMDLAFLWIHDPVDPMTL